LDVRHGSPTYAKHVRQESAESRRQLYIPAGFAHGLLTLEDDVVVMYKVTDYYDGGICWDNPEIAIPCPCGAADMIVSDTEHRLPLLKDFAKPFAYNGQPLEPLKASELA